MDGFKEFGVAMTGLFPVGDAVSMARRAEQLGMGSVWFAEDYFFRGGIPYIASAAMATEKIRIGLGVVNPYTRHPALMAMEFATLDEMSDKRTVFGLGSGVPFWMKQMGYEFKKPLSRTKACIELVRKIMTGDNINHKDEFFEAHDIQLVFQPVRTDIPIFLAFEGKQGLKLCGEIGDGVILSVFNTPAYVKFAWDRIKKGAEEAGRSLEDYEMVSYLPVVIDDDLNRAIAIARDFMVKYLAHSQAGGPLMTCAGITKEQTLAFGKAAKRGEDWTELVTDEMVQTLGIVGDVESAIEQIQAIINAGANTPVLLPIPGIDVLETTETVAKKIVPYLE